MGWVSIGYSSTPMFILYGGVTLPISGAGYKTSLWKKKNQQEKPTLSGDRGHR